MKTGLLLIIATMVVVLLTALDCSSIQENIGLENKIWKLESYGEEGSLVKVLDGTEITATFDSDKNEVRGSGGVNTYSGIYKIDGDKINIIELAWTEMARVDPPGVMEQEEQYLKVFKAAERFEITNGKLKMTSGNFIIVYYEEDTGMLQGLVSIGPITPVEKPGEKLPIPPEVYEARKIIVYDKSGTNLIQQVDIDDEGRYVARLKPGTYTVDINHIGIDYSDDVPKQVDIKSGITTRLDIDIDTGIR